MKLLTKLPFSNLNTTIRWGISSMLDPSLFYMPLCCLVRFKWNVIMSTWGFSPFIRLPLYSAIHFCCHSSTSTMGALSRDPQRTQRNKYINATMLAIHGGAQEAAKSYGTTESVHPASAFVINLDLLLDNNILDPPFQELPVADLIPPPRECVKLPLLLRALLFQCSELWSSCK